MTTSDLAATIRSVKAQVAVPVTYADVWEYWLRNREIYDAVDFVTIHILPYWEDFPIRAKYASAHVDAIRRRMAVAFPGKEILIGETGWPSEGRMREGALPSRTNQARVVSEILDLAKRENFRVNLIEAYDQPWKRQLEGTVGGYWGLFDSVQRALKYPPGDRHQQFSVLEAADGMRHGAERPRVRRGLADAAAPALDAAAGLLDRGLDCRRPRPAFCSASPPTRCSMKATALAAGSAGARCWPPRIASPLLAANALMSGRSLPTFLELLGPREWREPDRSLTVILGARAAGDHPDRRRDRARLRVRPALPRFSVCLADHGGGAVLAPDAAQPPAAGRAPDRGSGVCRAVGGGGALHDLQRRIGQLAVAVDLRDLFPARRYAVAGAGRAKPKMSRPIARPDSAIL